MMSRSRELGPSLDAVETMRRLEGAQGGRLLVVEDEMLISMELCNDLASLGWEIVGPAGSIEEAFRLLEEFPALDAAVLDVNLGGTLIYPLAERLMSRGVPLVFCTGYERVDHQEHYHACPIVRKPVNVNLLDGELRRARRAA